MNLRLEPCDGPACPRCGCQDAEILREADERDESDPARAWWGSGRARCRHCGVAFSFRRKPLELDGLQIGVTEEDAVPYQTVHCPRCDSTDCPVTKTERPIRRHKCRKCGKTFKSVEMKP